MRYDDFIERVRQRAGLQDKRESENLVRVVFETLGERLHKTEREKLAAQLPNRIKDYLGGRPAHDFFLLEEFYTRVSARIEVRYHRGVEMTRAVIGVLKESVSPGELEDVIADLTEDYRELFNEKEISPVSPSY